MARGKEMESGSGGRAHMGRPEGDRTYVLPPDTSPCQLCTNVSVQHKHCMHALGSCSHKPLKDVHIIRSVAPWGQQQRQLDEVKGAGVDEDLNGEYQQRRRQQQHQNHWGEGWQTPTIDGPPGAPRAQRAREPWRAALSRCGSDVKRADLSVPLR